MGVITANPVASRRTADEATSMLVAQLSGRIHHAGREVGNLLGIGITNLTGLDIREILAVELPPPGDASLRSVDPKCPDGIWISRASAGFGAKEQAFELKWKPVRLGWVSYWLVSVRESPILADEIGQPDISGGNWQIISYHRPVGSRGGDVLVVDEISPEYIFYFLGDVAGHSRGADIVRMMLTSYLRIYRDDFDSTKAEIFPGALLSRMNDALCEDEYNDSLLTGLVLLLEKHGKAAWYASAGHNPVYLVRNINERTALETQDIPLGIHRGIHYGTGKITCEPHDRILCFTDGLVINGPSADYSARFNSLLETIESNAGATSESLAFKLRKFLTDRGAGKYFCENDVTFSVISLDPHGDVLPIKVASIIN